MECLKRTARCSFAMPLRDQIDPTIAAMMIRVTTILLALAYMFGKLKCE